jgi:hypothetical protein
VEDLGIQSLPLDFAQCFELICRMSKKYSFIDAKASNWQQFLAALRHFVCTKKFRLFFEKSSRVMSFIPEADTLLRTILNTS